MGQGSNRPPGDSPVEPVPGPAVHRHAVGPRRAEQAPRRSVEEPDWPPRLTTPVPPPAPRRSISTPPSPSEWADADDAPRRSITTAPSPVERAGVVPRRSKVSPDATPAPGAAAASIAPAAPAVAEPAPPAPAAQAPAAPRQGDAGAASGAPRRAIGRPTRAAEPARGGGTASGRRHRPLWLSVLINVLVALVAVSLVQAFVVRVHNVSSGSMQRTLGVTDRVLSSRLPYLGGGPARGDIVIFAHGETWDTPRIEPDANPLRQVLRLFGDLTGIGISNEVYTVKRVIGVGGDTVDCCDAAGSVRVNGQSLSEPYLYQDLAFQPGQLDCLSTPRSARCFGPIAVPAGKLLVLGDHRSNSADSVASCRGSTGDAQECAHFVDVERVSGKVIGRAWPPGPIG